MDQKKLEKLERAEKSNRTALKVIGVLELLCTALLVVVGIVLMIADNRAEVAQAAGMSSPAAVGALFFVLAAIELLTAILLFRCAKDGRHSTLLIILAVLSIILGIVNKVMSGSTEWSWSGYISDVINVFIIIAALQLRKLDTQRAGK